MTNSNPITRLSKFNKERQERNKKFRASQKELTKKLKATKTSKVIRGAITGPIKAINETIEFVDDIKDYVKGNPYDNNDFFPLQNTPLESEDDQDDPFYKIPQAITQFLLPMGLISKGLSKAGMANVWARNALSGFVADAVVQDPLEENLFNMLDNHPRLENPITEILKTDEDATVIENRLRQAGGGFLAGEVVTALGLGIKGLKKSPELVDRIVKRLDERKKIKVNDFTTDNLGDEILDLGLDKQPVITTPKNTTPVKFDLPDTRGQGKFYHGSSKEIVLEEGGEAFSPQNIYGNGFYTSEDLVTAAKYKKKNRIKGEKPSGVVYEITEKQSVNFYDLDQPVDADLKKYIDDFDDSIYENVVFDAVDELGNDFSLGELFDEIRAYSRSRDVSSSVVIDEIFENFQNFLRTKGFGGFTHQGGKLAGKGKRLHQVKIYFDPFDQININKVDLDALADPKIQTTFNPKFTGTSEEVRTNLLDLAEELKKKDSNNTWPYRRTFADMAAAANAKLPAEIIEEARFFNQTYGRGGEKDLPALLISMNQLMNKNANDLADLAAQLDMATTVNNTEAIKELGDQLVREAEVLNSLVYINKPLKSIPAQTLAANRVAGGAGKTAATADDLVSKSPIAGVPGNIEDAAKGTTKAAEDMDQTLKQVVDLVKEGNKEATRKLKNITKKLQAAKGNPEAMREMARGGFLRKTLEINNELFINAILSGPQTHAVNVVSTALNTLVRPFDQSVGGLIKGDMTEFMRGGKELFYLAQSSGDALKAMAKAFQVEDNIINPSSMIDDRAEAAKRFRIRMDGPGWIPSLVNFAGTAIRLPSRFLLSEDEFFKQINFRAYVKATAWENGVKAGRTGESLKNYIEEQFEKTIEIVNKNSMANVDDENIIDLYEKAQQYAAEVTFTNDLPQGSFGGDFQTFINKHPSARIFFPFVRTPVNLLKNLGRRTAITAPFMDEYRQALKSTDPSIAAKARGELATGSMLWVTAGAAAFSISDDFSEIAITGGGPRDFDLLNQKRQTGWQPYSFRFLQKDENGEPIIGDDGRPKYKYISYQRLDPWSSFLSMSADITQIAGQLDYQDRQDLATVAVTALSRNITNKTYLQGITELAQLLAGEPYVLETYLQKRLAATVPFSALGRTIKKEIDPTIKDKSPKAGDDGMVFVRRFWNELAAVIPGFGDLKPKQNFITGALIEYQPGYGPDNLDLLNPIRTSNSVNNLVMTTLDDIQMKVAKPKDRFFSKDKFTGIELNSDQYQDYVNTIAFTKINGKRLVYALYETMQKKEIKSILATARGEDITAINQDISVAAQEKARRDAQDIFRDIINAYKKKGRIDWLKKPENRDLVKEYDANVNAINQTKINSILENYLQSISN